MTEDSDNDYEWYQRKAMAEMRPWKPGESVEGVSISEADKAAGSPKEGDMLARNPSNHDDRWLVSAAYFAANFGVEPARVTVAEASLAIQLVTLLMIVGVTVSIWRTQRSLKASRKYIEAYRHDIDWLTARVDELERKTRLAP